MEAEKRRLEEIRSKQAPWRKWDRIYLSASGAPCARTTVSRVMRGTTSRTTMHARARIGGAKMGWQALHLS
jgi:hypothetical protein